ncbi:uridine kinase [Motilibacter peucedani]|uniref:Uridine kinase n=1 Tax=Motilibacter peucedani TaxID=598650 RepID=A0A420XSF0_9ACTN|nr:hypothetical protein [Motilibacter peucedani]RKS77808.1 uridine kinase [Motilibacter peucedani]
MPSSVAYAALAARVLARRPRLGAVRLVTVDGPAGSGKTTFAGRLHAALEAAAGAELPLVHLDDLYEGWAGLGGVAQRLEDTVLAPLADGRTAHHPRWDWEHDAWGGTLRVDPAPALVVEGCGSGDRRVTAYAVLGVWVEAPSDLRLRRGLERDGEGLRAEWLRWRELESAHFIAEGTRRRADLRVDGAPPQGSGGDDVAVLLGD